VGHRLPAAYQRFHTFFTSSATSYEATQARIGVEEYSGHSFGNAFLDLDPASMRNFTASITDRWDVNRPRNSGVTTNVLEANVLASLFVALAANPGTVVRNAPIAHVTEHCGNSLLPSSASSIADAFTLGENIFWKQGWCPGQVSTTATLSKRSHEYIHVLEFQALGSIKMLDYYNWMQVGEGTGWNIYEAPAYAWEAWTWIYGEPSWSYFHAAS
jgi:hypothetical protein